MLGYSNLKSNGITDVARILFDQTGNEKFKMTAATAL